jgi:hypothetical protein
VRENQSPHEGRLKDVLPAEAQNMPTNERPTRVPVLPLRRRDAFPPCRQLASWPGNYPTAELADLEDDEDAETEPARFVYSEAELEGWACIVNVLRDEVTGPHLGERRPWRPRKTGAGDAGFRALLRRLGE